MTYAVELLLAMVPGLLLWWRIDFVGLVFGELLGVEGVTWRPRWPFGWLEKRPG